MLIIYLPPEMHCDDNAAAVFSAPCVTDTVRTHKSVQCVRTLQNEDNQSKRGKKESCLRRFLCRTPSGWRRRLSSKHTVCSSNVALAANWINQAKLRQMPVASSAKLLADGRLGLRMLPQLKCHLKGCSWCCMVLPSYRSPGGFFYFIYFFLFILVAVGFKLNDD